ncbi:MAG: hypothetical protein M3P33_00295 [bacterium]|nr:hypothetical protein [bacterium]
MQSKNKLSVFRQIFLTILGFSALSFLFLLGAVTLFPEFKPKVSQFLPNSQSLSSPSSSPIANSFIDPTKSKTIAVKNNQVPPVTVSNDYKIVLSNESNVTLLVKDVGSRKRYVKTTTQQNLNGDSLKTISTQHLSQLNYNARYTKYFKTGNIYGLRNITNTLNNSKLLVYNFLADGTTTHIILISQDQDSSQDENKLALDLSNESDLFISNFQFESGTQNDINTLPQENIKAQEQNQKDYEQTI